MYCSNCGGLVNEKLKYCNSCGERLIKDEDKHGSPGKMLDNILTTLFLVVLFGLGILVGLVAVLLDKNIDTGAVVMIVVVYLTAIFGICFALARQAIKLIDYRLKGWNMSAENSRPQHLPTPTTAQLEEYREPAMSVTDHTTRTLNKVPAADN